MKAQKIYVCSSCYDKIRGNVKIKRLIEPMLVQKCSMCGKKKYNIPCQIGDVDEN